MLGKERKEKERHHFQVETLLWITFHSSTQRSSFFPSGIMHHALATNNINHSDHARSSAHLWWNDQYRNI